MVAIDPNDIDPIANAIYKSYEDMEAAKNEPRRGHIGASEIGGECEREIWYKFRWVAEETHEGRMLRLFRRGNREELEVIEDLRRIGCEVFDKDENGERFRRYLYGGHYSSEFDAVATGLPGTTGEPHIVEIKTHKNTKYNAVIKHGVEAKEPKHYSQMQSLMDFFDVGDALYFPVCKNSDNMGPKRFKRKKRVGKALREKALRIIKSEGPPEGVSDSPKAFACRFCNFKDNCFENKVADVNCRTCVHATPDTKDGGWLCRISEGGSLSESGRCVPGEAGCPEHLLIPPLIPYAKPINSGDGFVTYESEHGQFANVTAQCFPLPEMNCYTSKELSVVNPMAVCEPAIGKVKSMFEGSEVVR